ncbi:MAG: PAS domain-containing sensor histidine kinase [Candidatus Dadabacteria bacterium]|nr:MAG: PAS domain-containing sensor histidine kinase [Candidatus Dadabacteria bacterium]
MPKGGSNSCSDLTRRVIENSSADVLSSQNVSQQDNEIVKNITLSGEKARPADNTCQPTIEDYKSLLDLTISRVACFGFEPQINLNQPAEKLVDLLWQQKSFCLIANESFARAYGFNDSSDIFGKPFYEVVPPSLEYVEMAKAWADNGYFIADYHLEKQNSDGESITILTSLYSVREGNNLKRLWLVNRDISEHIHAIDLLQKAEEHYRTLVERPGLVLVRSNPDGGYQYISPHVADIVGYPPNVFHEDPEFFQRLIHPDDITKHDAIIRARRAKSHKTVEAEYRVKHRDGTYHWIYERQTPKISDSGEIEYYDSIAFDIQEKKHLELELMRAQRMETIGTLAAGIAHDFNNHLTAVLGQIRMVIEELGSEHPSFEKLAAAENAALCCAEMTHQLTSLEKNRDVQLKVRNLNQLIQQTLSLLRHVLPTTITITSEGLAQDCPVNCNAAQIQQVLMNLAVNSRDAMKDRGEIKISLAPYTIKADQKSKDFSSAPAGQYYQVTVRDSGPGIPPSHIPHLFEPFFTTKRDGSSSGLGLSVVYSIIKAHGGYITVLNGTGAAISFILPAAKDSDQQTDENGNTGNTSGTEMVLVADDDEMVLSMVTTALGLKGYRVLKASDGEQALRLFRKHRKNVRLALIDQTMPGFTGREIIAAINEFRPDLPVILTSGYHKDEFEGDLARGETVTFLPKPYMLPDLLALIRKLIDKQATRQK